MKKRSKLSLHRETIARLESPQLRAAVGGDCTCSCCDTQCNCPAPTDYCTYSCESCPCGTEAADSRCVCI